MVFLNREKDTLLLRIQPSLTAAKSKILPISLIFALYHRQVTVLENEGVGGSSGSASDRNVGRERIFDERS